MGKIKMGGNAVMEFEPDYCEFHITVNVQKGTSSTALKKGRERVEEILMLLTEKAGLKIEDITLDKESNDFSNYSDEKYYRYYKSFYFRHKADNKFIDTVVKLLENTDDTEYDVKYKLENEAEKEQIVMKKAVADAREKAEKLANALGTKINGFEEIKYEFHDDIYFHDEVESENKFYDIMSVFQPEKPSLAAQMGLPKIEIKKSVDIIWLTD